MSRTQLKRLVTVSADVGVHVVNVSPGPQRWVPGHGRIPLQMSEGTAWLMIAHDYYTTLPLFMRDPSEYLGINMDPSHGNLCRNDIPWVVKLWGRRIKHSHLKDSAGTPSRDGDTFIFAMPGEDQVN